jgi:ribosomal protein S14
MLSSKIKDLKLREKVYNIEIDKNISKFMFVNILNNKKSSPDMKKKATFYLINMLNKGQSKTKIVRRCSMTTRSRVSHRKLGISRIRLREMLKAGVLPGYSKAIW